MLKVALVGCGKIADAHVEQIRAIGRGEVVAVCDRDPLMVEQLAVRMGVEGRYTEFDEMLRVTRPDVVHIATPPASHIALTCAALRFGCHAFVEKPFALNAADAKVILDCAQETGKRISVNYHNNFEPAALVLEELLASRALGDIVHLDTTLGYGLAGDYGLAVMADPAHWVHGLPGKLFQNVLDHVLAKVVAHIPGDTEVKVQTFRRRPATGNQVIDALNDELQFIIRNENTTVFGLVSAHGRPLAHTLRVVGTRDTVELEYSGRTLVHSANWSQPSAVGRLFPAWVQARQFRRNAWHNLGRFRRHEFHYFQGMRVLLGRFYDAVEGKGNDPIESAQILQVCRVIDQIVLGMGAAR